ncbi:hypothetical protein D8674_000692 [Pyrus ussuriensis x Pyrus communis]|uniref:Uncharacterized protein n=1 Tax=Pyrus ussuriensis x Pyrus communis TaxID=2448454 RepID=A0A5N5F975_9ROSA|nr:hypothetical protein D8674_000692 [Pyrus ussuriensis x Pyrus communis]
MDLSCTKDGTSTIVHDKVKDAYSLGDKDASKLSTAKHGLSNPKLKEPTYEDVVNQKCTRLTSDVVSDIRKETPTCNDTTRTPATDDAILNDVEQDQPMFNIKKESPTPQPLPGTGDACFSGDLFGNDGTNRFLGKWCKRNLNKGSESRQNPSADSSNLIDVGADGRGGRIKVLRSLNHSTDNKENAPGTKRFKSGSMTNSVQSQRCLQKEHFVGRDGR